MKSDVKYPDIHVQLTGRNGNAFLLLGVVVNAMQKAGVPKEERDLFMKEATHGDYDALLSTCAKWVDVS